MTEQQARRLIHRVQVKEILRRQAIIRPGATMFDGVEPDAFPLGFPFKEDEGEGVCPVEYGAGPAGVLSLDTIMRRVVVLETWIDSQLSSDETL